MISTWENWGKFISIKDGNEYKVDSLIVISKSRTSCIRMIYFKNYGLVPESQIERHFKAKG